ncbi:DNA mismatch repair protein C-terminal [Penicillium canariense]|uniref:DNA mismatch repair protein C-terminal n=1 Tax=Penicillium canariense TaxID=189055 RepID=A0A9W9HWM5_9EURO|nr:DNA mismatch repair protein C-terminal [Penicillium canariense]KAJ5157734.1 DNA mismatch repair protein C-terminal [Penicillium canariense]
MPIEALPHATVRAIGSTSVISDPCSVVKELIDNALDASTSSVIIEISQNTVDVIQVKDNGHGITAEDHHFVCKPAYTSKISTIDDLKNVGGTSLGFRGEALASIAEMSAGVIVTTRVASDIVASKLQYARDGGLSLCQKLSHPIGTTVCIKDFLKFIPVRRQAALKGATKTLTKIKRLVQTYAMAQLSKRFSLKVLKAKNENNNWIYAPGANPALADAAVKVVGRDVTSCCIMKEAVSGIPTHNDENPNQSQYHIVALLPRNDTDFTKVNNTGQFLSIDGRPISTCRGVGHDIVKLFQSYARAAASKCKPSQYVSNPFLCIQLKCPLGTYDINIEPGKDDVIFEDRDFVFSMVENLFIDHYGALPGLPEKSPIEQIRSSSAFQEDASFELLMARRPLPLNPPSSHEQMYTVDAEASLASSYSPQPLSSHGAPSPEQTPRNRAQNVDSHTDEISGGRSSRYINPWSISRINASFQAPLHENIPLLAMTKVSPEVIPKGTRQRDEPQRHISTSPPHTSVLFNPSLSRRTPVSPASRRLPPQSSQESLLQSSSLASASPRARRERDRERYGNGALDTLFQRTTQTSLGQRLLDTPPEPNENTPSLSQLAQQRFNPPLTVTTTSVVLDGHRDGHHPPDDPPRGQTPDTSPQHYSTAASPQNEYQTESMDSGRGFPVLEKWAANIHGGFNAESSSELEKAMEFERRKREANQKRRIYSDQSNSRARPSTSNSPHHNRYLAAKSALAVGGAVEDPASALTLPQSDPRSYLIRHQSDQRPDSSGENTGKARRLQTSRLPLERIPEDLDLHNLCLPIPTDSSDILQSFNMTVLHDSYTRCGAEAEAFFVPNTSSRITTWNDRLSAIINKAYKTRGESRPPIGASISALRSPIIPSDST